MNIILVEDHQALSAMAADLLVAALAWKPNLKLCPVSGETPRRTYELFVQRVRSAGLSTSALRIIELDEWCGLPATDSASTDHYIHTHLVAPLGVAAPSYVGFDGANPDLDAECRQMRAWLRQYGPLDVCVLGLGLNGHLAFNEPGETLGLSTHIAELATETQGHSMLEDAETQPTSALTLGMGDIMAAKQVILLVSGRHKAKQMRALVDRDITTRFPASMLWLHPNTTCICDRSAYELCDPARTSRLAVASVKPD